MTQDNPFIVEAQWLHSRLEDPQTAIVDGSWYLPPMNRDGKAEYLEQHIPGSVFFDIDAITEPGSQLPHTLAPSELFEDAVSKLGISDQYNIVVYDGMGLFSAPRVWWNFRIMGARNVYVLDGGLPAWLEQGLPVESGTPTIERRNFSSSFNRNSVIAFDEMQQIVSQGTSVIADARPEGRFTGKDPEPRAGMRSGHMPGATSIPFSELAKDGHLRSKSELQQIFQSKGIGPDTELVTTCGSGVTAAALILALKTVGHENHRLYDGSWAEWGSRTDTEVVSDQGS